MSQEVDIAIIGAGAAGLMAGIWAGRSSDLPSPRKGPGVGSGHHDDPTTDVSGRSGAARSGDEIMERKVADRPPQPTPQPPPSSRGSRIVALDGARTLGAKILVAGGGRCNVTHYTVDESAYAGSSRHAIKKVLRQFEVPRTVEFFADLGVELKREETGKLFPVTDRARSVLDALLRAAGDAGVAIVHPWRVDAVERDGDAFVIRRPIHAGHGATSSSEFDSLPPAPSLREGEFRARRIVLATGGMSLPKSGSDGHGFVIARSLGHSITPRVLPALVPLTLPGGYFLCGLSGIAVPATIELRSPTGKRLESFTNSTLFTHFGLSGPGVLDISRYYLAALSPCQREGPGLGFSAGSAGGSNAGPQLLLNCLPGETPTTIDAALVALGNTTPLRFLASRLPDRLARALCQHAGVDPTTPGHQLTRDRRRALAVALTELPLPITGSRGFTHAEVTAGGVPLSEIHLETMESRVCPGLHLCGEICDVDGRIGGFNFQWAWASGYVAGRGAGAGLRPPRAP